MSEKTPTFEELVGDLNTPQAKETIQAINFSTPEDPIAKMNDFERLERMAQDEAPKPPDDNEPRYGMSPVFDIYVAKENSNNNYGKFGLMDFLPRLALIPFYNTVFDVPAEQNGSVVVGESIDDILTERNSNFDFGAAQSAIQGGFNQIRKTAKQLAELFLADHQGHGAGIFEPLQNPTYAQANKIYSVVLPYKDKQFFIDKFGEKRTKARVVLGYKIDDSPFLDVMTEYLEKFAEERIETSTVLSVPEREKALEVHQLLLAFCETGTIHARQKIEEKEQEIRENKTRGGYDRPNRLAVGAPKPPDLVRLAHLNRVPMDERATRDIMDMGEAIAQNMNFPAPNAQVSNLPGNFSMDEIINAAKKQLMQDQTFIASVEQSVLKKAGLA